MRKGVAMPADRRPWRALLTGFLLLFALAGCQSMKGPVAPRTASATTPEDLAIAVDGAELQVRSISLRPNYQTYYLMNYPPVGHVFLHLVLDIEGLDDPVAWGLANLRLEAAGERREPVLARPVTAGDGYQYGSTAPLEFVYEFFFHVPSSAGPLDSRLVIEEGPELLLPPLPPVRTGPLLAAKGGEPPAEILSGLDNQAVSEGALVAGGRENRVGATYGSVGGGRLNEAGLAYSAIAGGRENEAGGFYAAIGGGYGNRISGREAVIAGGSRNLADARYVAIGGGIQNQVAASSATVAGGAYNRASGLYAAIGGGTRNTVEGEGSVVAGGAGNGAVGEKTSVVGGLANRAEGPYASVLGGYGNRADGQYAVALGGEGNLASGDHSLAAGRGARIAPEHQGALVWSDSIPAEFRSAAPNELAVRATGGVRLVTAVDGEGRPVGGVMLAPGSGSWSILSDVGLKEGFQPPDRRAVLEGVRALEIAAWRYRSEDDGVLHLGPSAQDFRRTFELGDSDRYISSVDADGVALVAIQGLLDELERQGSELARLEARVKALESESASPSLAQGQAPMASNRPSMDRLGWTVAGLTVGCWLATAFHRQRQAVRRGPLAGQWPSGDRARGGGGVVEGSPHFPSSRLRLTCAVESGLRPN